MTAYNILEIDTEIIRLLTFEDVDLKQIEELKIKKLNLYESTKTVTT